MSVYCLNLLILSLIGDVGRVCFHFNRIIKTAQKTIRYTIKRINFVQRKIVDFVLIIWKEKHFIISICCFNHFCCCFILRTLNWGNIVYGGERGITIKAMLKRVLQGNIREAIKREVGR